MTEVDPYGTSFNGCHCQLLYSSVAQFVNDSCVLTTAEILILPGPLLLLTLAKAACANTVPDSIAPFMKKIRFKIRSDPMQDLTTRT